jgi:hypothetical protein
VIVASEQDAEEYRIVTQPDHAFFAGEILALWREDGLPANLRRAEVIFAGREHDNGWREADAAPRCDGAGQPIDFAAMPAAERMAIWDRGTERFRRQRPYATLLIVRHARELHRERRREERWRDFLHRLAIAERRLRQDLRVSGKTVTADYRFVAAADRIALAVCAGWGGNFKAGDLRGRVEPPEAAEAAGAKSTGLWTVRLAPLPLAGATTFQVRMRRIPRRRYRGDADLGSELAAARWQEMTVRLAPFDDDGPPQTGRSA